MKNKIILLVSSMNSGGAERVASTLANAWVSRGDQVILMPTFSGRGECFYQLSSGVRLVYLADLIKSNVRKWGKLWRRLFALRRFIVKERPDVIVSFLPNVNVAAIIASIGLAIPIIVCERTDPFVMPISRFWRLACCMAYPFADALMVQTQSVAHKYASTGCNLRRIRVVPNPVPKQMLNIKRCWDDARVKRILSVGRLEDEKQFCILIKVFADLAQAHPDWTLRIVGEGSLRGNLQRQVSDLGLDARVELPGRTLNIQDEFMQADVFALTSKYEGFPNALLEAMALSLPCVAFDCSSGPREMSMEGQVALLVPLNDTHALKVALERLLVDEDLRISLGAKACASVMTRFSLDKVLEDWDLLLNEVRK